MTRDLFYLTYIAECIERIESFTSEGRDAFMADRRSQDAVLRNLELIGATVKRLSATARSNDSIGWSDIAGMRDVLAHDYLEVDLGRIWNIAKEELPGLRAAVARQLSGEQ